MREREREKRIISRRAVNDGPFSRKRDVSRFLGAALDISEFLRDTWQPELVGHRNPRRSPEGET